MIQTRFILINQKTGLIEKYINLDMKNQTVWLNANKMSLNVQKLNK